VRDAERRDKKKAKVFEIPVPKGAGVTFHGRDVFAPFVAKASASKLKKLDRLAGREFPGHERDGNHARGEIVAHDHYGNLVTSLPLSVGEPREGKIADRSVTLKPAESYQSIAPGDMGLVRGSHGYWEIACHEASALDRLKIKRGHEVTLTVV
jgi:S-adenosylmethionine hydrolase